MLGKYHRTHRTLHLIRGDDDGGGIEVLAYLPQDQIDHSASFFQSQ